MEQHQSISLETFKTAWWLLTIANGVAFLLIARYGYSWFCLIRQKEERRKFFTAMTAFAAVGVVLLLTSNYFDVYLARLAPHVSFAVFLYSFLYAAHKATLHMERLRVAPRASAEAITETEKVFASIVRPLINGDPVEKRDIRQYQNIELKTHVVLK